MKKRDIIIIIILTVILLIALTATLQKKPEIESVYLSPDKESNFEELKLNEYRTFKDKNTDIYLIMKVNHLTVDDEIKIIWKKIEDNNNENYNIVQENIFNPEQNGSGKIVILLVKRDDIYASGKYCLEVYLNGDYRISRDFFINS